MSSFSRWVTMTWSTSLTRLSQDWSVWKIWLLRGATWRPYLARLCLTLRNLVTLRLRHLSISTLEDQNFRKLSALRGLEVDSWPYLEYISPLSFQGLNLSWLFITNTNISSVPSASFRNLAYLTALNLSYNPISTLESWAFRDLIRPVYMWFICLPACHVTVNVSK